MKNYGGFKVRIKSSGCVVFAQLWCRGDKKEWYIDNNWYPYEVAKKI